MTTPPTLADRVRTRRRLPDPVMRRAIRQSLGLSAGDVARDLGVSRQAVSRWELGLRTPRGRELEAYVQLLDELAALARDAS